MLLVTCTVCDDDVSIIMLLIPFQVNISHPFRMDISRSAAQSFVELQGAHLRTET